MQKLGYCTEVKFTCCSATFVSVPRCNGYVARKGLARELEPMKLAFKTLLKKQKPATSTLVWS